MSHYKSNLRDLEFTLFEVLRVQERMGDGPYAEMDRDTAHDILTEVDRLARGPLSESFAESDRHPPTFDPETHTVVLPEAFKKSYQALWDGEWYRLDLPSELGGFGAPSTLRWAASELMLGANPAVFMYMSGPSMAYVMHSNGTPEQQHWAQFMIDKGWCSTMVLTEADAGSDVGAGRTKAIQQPDGSWHLEGVKRFITSAEHDLSENIVHLVLARPEGPGITPAPGTKGLSLFLVPKYHFDTHTGELGARNGVFVTGVEHKMGLNGNPTCTMNMGEKGGAVGYLVGEANRGLEYMFIMMNAARFSVGVQRYAIADRAYQRALEYAKDRVQSRDVAARNPQAVRIIEHPDVRRMLMSCKSQPEAMRALSYVTAASLDFAHRHPDEAVRKQHKAYVELMIPVVKAWCTETAPEVASTALQVFGGIGYIEETGIAQPYRDVRIPSIYEGTTGIQALDLVGRKLIRDMGATATTVIKSMKKLAAELEAAENEDVKHSRAELEKGIDILAETSQWIGMNAMGDLKKAFACSVPYLKLWGIVAGGHQMARSAQISAEKIAGGDSDPFYAAKITTARFYADHILAQALFIKHQIVQGAGDVMTLTEEQFDLDRKSPVVA